MARGDRTPGLPQNPLRGIPRNGFGRAASEKDPQGHLAGVVPRHAAIPARLRRNGPGNGFARRCARGERATALRRPRTTGRARTHAGAAAKRSNDYRPENGPRRPLSSICTGAGRRPSPTPSAARERLGVNAGEMRTRRLRLAAACLLARRCKHTASRGCARSLWTSPTRGPSGRSLSRNAIAPPAATSVIACVAFR